MDAFDQMLSQVMLNYNYHGILTETLWRGECILYGFIMFSLIPFVKAPALTTTASRRNPFFLTVALSAGGWAQGDLFWDDGDSLDTVEMGNYCYIIFNAGQVGTRRVIFALGKLMRQCFAFYCTTT